MDETKSESDVCQDKETMEKVADCDAKNDGDNDMPPKKKKAKLPKGLQKLVDKINTNENVRQMVVFTLFSFICGGSQLILTLALTQLKYVGGVLAEPFKGIPVGSFSIFGYETTAEFIGFLVGSITGQVLTFVLNRKKTFNCTNNVVISGIMYAILAVFIIFMQTLLGGSALGLLFNLAGQAVGAIAALVISFLGNKFLVMRNWGSKKATAETTDSAPTEEN